MDPSISSSYEANRAGRVKLIPVMGQPPSPEEIKRVRLLVWDFDGVFTDNAVYVFQDGTEAVRCSRLDGMGITLLRQKELPMMVVSREENPVVLARCEKLRLRCVNDCTDKVSAVREIIGEMNLTFAQVAFVGNDLNDAGLLKEVGLPIVVADAHDSVLHIGRYRTCHEGGNGAVREVCDWFLEWWTG